MGRDRTGSTVGWGKQRLQVGRARKQALLRLEPQELIHSLSEIPKCESNLRPRDVAWHPTTEWFPTGTGRSWPIPVAMAICVWPTVVPILILIRIVIRRWA